MVVLTDSNSELVSNNNTVYYYSLAGRFNPEVFVSCLQDL